jgi:hypothetical protein
MQMSAQIDPARIEPSQRSPEASVGAKEIAVERQHLRRYPKHQFIHLCNTIPQFEIFCAA